MLQFNPFSGFRDTPLCYLYFIQKKTYTEVATFFLNGQRSSR
jgi:hypothetical protein